MFNSKNPDWYAAFVVTGEEDHVKERLKFKLKSRDIGILVPKRKIRERRKGVWETHVKTLFPGYILIRGPFGVDEYYLCKDTPGIIRFLGDSTGLLHIDEEEIHIIHRIIDQSEVIGSSKVTVKGNKVFVIDGPLCGLDGLIESIDKRKGRAKVRLTFIGESRLVDLSVSIVDPL